MGLEQWKHWMRPRGSRCRGWPQSKDRKSCLQKWALSGLGILATQAHRLCLVSLGSVPWHFLPEPCEFGCTYSTEQVIKVTDDTQFKEWFRQIPSPLVEEVCAHLWEMLDAGMICPSQSAWCMAVVLVMKKDGSLHGSLHRLTLSQHPHKEGLLSIAKNPRGTQKPGWCWPFFMPRAEVWILADQDGWTVKAVHYVYCWQPQLFECGYIPFGLCNMPAMFQRLMQNYLWELNLTYCLILPWWYNHFLGDNWRTPPLLMWFTGMKSPT